MTRQIRATVLATMAALLVGAGCFGGSSDSNQPEANQATQTDEYSADLSVAALPSNVLLFGDYSFAINNFEPFLENLGHTVTVPNDYRLPTNLEGFHTIWHIGQQIALTPSEIDRLAGYLANGGGLFLTGETLGAGSLNASLSSLVNQVVISGGVTLGTPAQVTGIFGSANTFQVHDGAAGDVASSPNNAQDLHLVGVGGITGVAPNSPNCLATGGFFGNQPVAAIWTSNDLVGGAGSLAVMMDSDWIANLNQQDNNELLENLQDGLRGVVNTPPREVEAGEDRTVACDPDSEAESLTVTLSGSAIDDDGDDLTFTWYRFGEVIATGANAVVELEIGTHFIVLEVSDGRSATTDDIVVVAECEVTCDPGPGLFTRCHPGCPCDHAEGDCDTDNDCLPGLVCLHDAGFAFGYKDNEVDVCSNKCPDLGVGAWNYCSPECPCDVGQGDCEDDIDCLPGLKCNSDIGPSFGFDKETDVCEPL